MCDGKILGHESGGHVRQRFGDRTLEIRGEDYKVDRGASVRAFYRYSVVPREKQRRGLGA